MTERRAPRGKQAKTEMESKPSQAAEEVAALRELKESAREVEADLAAAEQQALFSAEASWSNASNYV